MKTTITTLILALAMITSISIHAQEREAPQLNLGDLGWTGTDFDSVTAFNVRPYLWGWNWLSSDGNVSQTLGMNVWHLNDPYAFWQDRFCKGADHRAVSLQGLSVIHFFYIQKG
jgi:hypothetical protein